MGYICRMNKCLHIVGGVWRLYSDGFKHMTWGRMLWIIIMVKLFIMFAILRIFFFRPAMKGLTEEQKSERVGVVLEQRR